MSKFDLKLKAHDLRRQGKSIREICLSLNVSKSTASLWCREVELTEGQKELLRTKMIHDGSIGRQKGADVNRAKKVSAQTHAKKLADKAVKKLSKRDLLIAGIALYWAEGSKAESTGRFIFVNSDPQMIKFMYKWLVESLGVSRDDIVGQVSINEIHRYRIDQVLNFWSRLLDLPAENFSKTFFAKSVQKKVYSNHSTHYGVFRLGVRNSSFLKYEVLAMIKILRAGVAQVVRASVS